MTTTNQPPASSLIGQSVLIGNPIAAEVRVIGARKIFGRVDLLVRDIRGRETWVREKNVQTMENNQQKAS